MNTPIIEYVCVSRPSSTKSENPPRWSASATMTPCDALRRHDQVRADGVRVVVDARDHARHHVLHVRPELELGDRPAAAGCSRRRSPSVASSGSTWYFSASAQNRSVSSWTFFGVLGGQVPGLAEVVGQVVQLDRIIVGVPDARAVRREGVRREDPGDAAGLDRQPPAVLVHGPIAERLEVLLGVPLDGVGVGE